MTKKLELIVLIALLIGIVCPTFAQNTRFVDGPVIDDFGKIAAVESDLPIPANTEFRIVFDMGERATPGTINRTITSAARFINMHVDAGVPPKNIHIAIVTHGSASMDVTSQVRYGRANKHQANVSASAIEVLMKHQVEVLLCGQSAAAHEIDNSDLLPGVKMALSAMTAHALLLQKGYTANPF